MRTFSIITLGCRVNQCESDEIAQGLTERGWENAPIGESDRKSRQMIRRAASQGSHVVVTGCFAQIAGEEAAKIPGVVYVCGNDRKAKIPAVLSHIDSLADDTDGAIPVDVDADELTGAAMEPVVLRTPKRVRSYIKIEDGCENRCAYCIIPRARGRVRSKPACEVLREAAHLAGYCRELILTGIETASYGMDLRENGQKLPYGMALAALLGEVDNIPGVERIGMGSLEPTVMSDAFVSALTGVTHILRHFHLSIQSGSTTVLHRMRRRYTAEMALAAMERVRAAMPDVTFGADVIVGFPRETEEEFAETIAFCRRARFLHLHIFPYSVREGTEAAEMADQIPESVKKARVRALEEVDEEIRTAMLTEYVAAHRTEPVHVLVEKAEDGVANGHTEHFVEVDIPTGRTDTVGKLLPVLLTETDGVICRGVFME